MTESIRTAPRTRRALAAKVAGIAGIVICAVIIVLIWLGRGAVAGAIDGLAADVNGAFDRAIAATDAVAGRLDEAATNAGSIGADAAEAVASASPDPERVAGLQARLGELGDRYRELRVRYGEVRENVSSAAATLRTIGRIVPGTRVPEPPGILADVDARLQEIDETLVSTWTRLQEADPGAAAASAISERATALQERVAGAADRVDGLTARLAAAQADAANAIGGIQAILLIAALVISAFLIWVLLLNVALLLLGRAWERDSMASAPDASAAASADTAG
jgi:hypothetical protein